MTEDLQILTRRSSTRRRRFIWAVVRKVPPEIPRSQPFLQGTRNWVIQEWNALGAYYFRIPNCPDRFKMLASGYARTEETARRRASEMASQIAYDESAEDREKRDWQTRVYWIPQVGVTREMASY